MFKRLVKEIINNYNKKAKEHKLVLDERFVINVIKDNEVIKQLSISNTTTVAEFENMLQK